GGRRPSGQWSFSSGGTGRGGGGGCVGHDGSYQGEAADVPGQEVAGAGRQTLAADDDVGFVEAGDGAEADGVRLGVSGQHDQPSARGDGRAVGVGLEHVRGGEPCGDVDAVHTEEDQVEVELTQ